MLSRMFRADPDPREIPNDEAATIYEENGAIFLDCREPDEWAEGHLPGAVLIPLGEVTARADELPRDQRIITVCKSGVRSLCAVDMLAAAGHQDAKSMAGGMEEWKAKGRPVE